MKSLPDQIQPAVPDRRNKHFRQRERVRGEVLVYRFGKERLGSPIVINVLHQ